MNVTVTPHLFIYKKKKKTSIFQGGWKGVWCFLATRYPNSDEMTGEAGSGEEGQGRQSTREEDAITVANCLSSNLLSGSCWGLTPSMVKYLNLGACQLPSALIPQDLLNCRETLHSPSSICSPIYRPGGFSRSTCLSWPLLGSHWGNGVCCPGWTHGRTCHTLQMRSQDGSKSSCSCWSSSPCLQVTRHQDQTHHSSGRDISFSHLKSEQKRLLGNLRGFIHLRPSGCGVDYLGGGFYFLLSQWWINNWIGTSLGGTVVLWCYLLYEPEIRGPDLRQNQSGPEKLAKQQIVPCMFISHSFASLC